MAAANVAASLEATSANVDDSHDVFSEALLSVDATHHGNTLPLATSQPALLVSDGRTGNSVVTGNSVSYTPKLQFSQ